MARRTRDDPSDSLELLLDTICNVFGGIILMAILVVLQTQVTAAVVRAPERDVRRRQVEFELGRAAKEVASLRAELDAISEGRPDVQVAAAIVGRKSEFLDAIEAAQRRLEEERGATRELAARTAALGAEAARADERVRRLGEEVDRARERLGAVAQAHRRDVRLPMWHDQVAPLQRSILIDGPVFGLPEHCTQTREGERGTRYTPVAGRGRPVADEEAARLVTATLMAGSSPRTTYVSFWVSDRAESFEAFQLLRAVVTELGFEYTVSAYRRDGGLVLHPGRPKAE